MDSRNEYYKSFCEENVFNISFPDRVGTLLKSKRLNSGLKITQQDMADIIGCNRTHISAIENGHCDISFNEFLAYSLVLQCPMDKLFPVNYGKIEKRYQDTLSKEGRQVVHREHPKALGD